MKVDEETLHCWSEEVFVCESMESGLIIGCSIQFECFLFSYFTSCLLSVCPAPSLASPVPGHPGPPYSNQFKCPFDEGRRLESEASTVCQSIRQLMILNQDGRRVIIGGQRVCECDGLTTKMMEADFTRF